MKLSLFEKMNSRISQAWKHFLKLYLCFSIITNFSGTFLNTYLVRATGSNEGVMIFNIVLAAVQPFAMIVSVYLMRKMSALFSQCIGMCLYALTFLTLFALGEGAIPYIQWIAAILSAANGFFYTTYALQLLSYTNDDDRDACYGAQAAIGGIIGIILPLLTGFLLYSFESFAGYRILFMIGFVISVAAVFMDLRLAPITNMSSQVQLKETLKVLVSKKPARAAMFATMASGFYGGTMTFYLSILVYAIVKNETVIGAMGTASSIIAIIASFVYARIVRPDNRTKVIALSLGITICSACILLFNTSLYVLIGFNLLLFAMNGFFLNPPVTAYFGVVENLPELRGLGSEVHALREFWYAAGRVLGVLMTMLVADGKNLEGLVILIILIIQIIPVLLMKQMKVSD